MKPSNNLENTTLSDTYWKVQLVCVKVQAHSSLEPPVEDNQDDQRLDKSMFVLTFWTILGVRNITQFQISSRKENR